MARESRQVLVDEEISTMSTDEDLGVVKEKQAWREKYIVPFVFIGFIVIGALDRIFLYRVQKSMADYTAILMSIYWPPMVQVMCFLVSLAYVFRKRQSDKSYNMAWFSPFSERASSQGAVPQKWIAQFALYDQVNAILSAPPSPFIPLVLQTPLNNLVVLFTAFTAFFYLKTRFKMVHYAGICIILCSCLVGVLVELQGPQPIICRGLHGAADAMKNPATAATVPQETRWLVQNATDDCVTGLPPYKNADGEIIYIAFGTLATMYLLYIFAIIPSAFSNCYKQKKLKQVNLDVMWSFFWSGMWQVFWGFLLYPLSWVPWPTPTGHNEAGPSTLSQDLKDSWTCFMGRNPKPSVTTCSAEPAWLWFMMYLLFNVFFNLFFLWLIKRLSGTWASIGSILCGNLCGIFSQFDLFAGPSAQKLTMEQWMALILSSIAMWVYNIEEEVTRRGKSDPAPSCNNETMLLQRRRCEESLAKCLPLDQEESRKLHAKLSRHFCQMMDCRIRAERHKEQNHEMMPVVVLLILVVLLGFIAFSLTVCCVDYSDDFLNYLEESNIISSRCRRRATEMRENTRSVMHLDRTKTI